MYILARVVRVSLLGRNGSVVERDATPSGGRVGDEEIPEMATGGGPAKDGAERRRMVDWTGVVGQNPRGDAFEWSPRATHLH